MGPIAKSGRAMSDYFWCYMHLANTALNVQSGVLALALYAHAPIAVVLIVLFALFP